MKAILCEQYAPPEQLQVKDLPKPHPGKGEVLIRVKASAVNDYDWCMVRGKPFSYRALFGWRKPKNPVPGMELSGVVEQVGEGGEGFRVGDRVYGDISHYGFGSFAEYLCIDAKALRLMPEGMDFTDAAALSHAWMLAWQALSQKAIINSGMEVLVNGAGGGVGDMAFQIARGFDISPDGVDTGDKLNDLRSMGYRRVMDYKKEDYTRIKGSYDIILDAKTTKWPWQCLRPLKKGGVYVTIGGSLSLFLLGWLLAPMMKLITGKHFKILGLEPGEGMDELEAWYLQGKIKPRIDGPYPLEKAGWAIRYFGEGQHSAKVIIAP